MQIDPILAKRNETEIIGEALAGGDLDVIFEKNRTYSPMKSIIDTPTALKTTKNFDGSFISTNNLLGIKTFASTTESFYEAILKIGNSSRSKTMTFYITCFINGQQIDIFNGKSIANISVNKNSNFFLKVKISKIVKGINYFKCYNLNGLINPTQASSDLLNPNNIPGLYIYKYTANRD